MPAQPQQVEQQVDINQPVSVTLPFGIWHTLLGLVGMAQQSLQETIRFQLAQGLQQARPRPVDDDEEGRVVGARGAAE